MLASGVPPGGEKKNVEAGLVVCVGARARVFVQKAVIRWAAVVDDRVPSQTTRKPNFLPPPLAKESL